MLSLMVSLVIPGISLLSPKIFDGIDPSSKEFPLRNILRPAILANRVSGEVFSGDWCDVGTIERYNHLNKKFNETNNANK